ncbi:Ig-like domain-containing protein [Solicola sp. PLA-1-18]|uniref:L,D-transpeptidase n=1 Tax=Solicola sp. PLA-1-18 TaxID=3380532 RepID=UPI003B75E3F5
MSPRRSVPATSVRHGLAAAAVATALVALVGCTGSSSSDDGTAAGNDASPASSKKQAAPATVDVNVPDGTKDQGVDTLVTATAQGGRLGEVTVYRGDAPTEKSTVVGSVDQAGTTWTARDMLDPGSTYTVKAVAMNADGKATDVTRTFTTEDLSLDQQTFPSLQPLRGETVGVGMPIVIRFDVPVKNKAEFEKRLEVQSTPQVEGTWSWVSDTEVRYRPREYWPAGTQVKVRARLNGVNAGDGVYGQENRYTAFTVGKKVVSTVDVGGHTMTVRVDGKVARKLPVTTGKDGLETREGTKIIMEKFAVKRMDAATTGVSEDSPEYYDIPDVRYAMRVTNTGEFIHAAPWSAGSQGSANVSHGCVGLSTSNAAWLYGISHRGDVVKFIDSPRSLEDDNGWTDWNESYEAFKKGSALS